MAVLSNSRSCKSRRLRAPATSLPNPRAPLSHIQLDFYGEGSAHADVVGGLDGIAPTAERAPRLSAGLWVVGASRMRRGAQVEDHPMTKSNPVDETRIADPVERAKRQRHSNAKKVAGTAKAPKQRRRRNSAVGSRKGTKAANGRQSKQQTCLDLLGRREGATIEDVEEATGWQKRSVRGFLAGAVKKTLGLTLVSEKPDAGSRRYRIPTTV
jgi:hypothetical protein